MNNHHPLLRATIAAALASLSASSYAATLAKSNIAFTGFGTAEASRVTQTVDSRVVSSLSKTHLAIFDRVKPIGTLPATSRLSHMQLILRPSAARATALQALISQQHDPASVNFHSWVTPEQFGSAFGVSDSDISATKAWLMSQGFTVNGVYPNKTQIDFSGTVGQINKSFSTQIESYKLNGETHFANAVDISVPAALQPVIVGAMGLNDIRPTALHTPSKLGTWNANTRKFTFPPVAGAANPLAVPFTNGTRGLVPDDLAKMYGISTIRNNGVTGKGITIAVVEDHDMVPADWSNFVSQFGLGSFGGTFSQINPASPTGPSNCLDDDTVNGYTNDDIETLMDAEWATAIAPGANIVVASCSDYDANFESTTDNIFGGVFVAASNVVNATASRPNVISVSYGYGEGFVDSASKTAIDLMWAQADAEGISVFVAAGDSGSNPSFNGAIINGAGVDANAFGTSPNVTTVGGTDTADVLDGTTSRYFSPTSLNNVYGTALGYVPEIPWNESCGNGVAAKVLYGGFSSAPAFCQFLLGYDTNGKYVTSEATSGGPSSVDRKPSWQRLVFNAAPDQSRDIPDVSLFAGSFGNATEAIICMAAYPCAPNFTTPVVLEGGTSLSSPMFAGIQALIDQGLVMRGLRADQGNAAPTLYALASQEYGTAGAAPPATLAACNADNGNTGTAACVFHNVTRGSISTECYEETEYSYITPDCYILGTLASAPPGGNAFQIQIGLTSTDSSQYGPKSKAYPAQPGWSFASGLGSVNATNLLIAWRAFVNAPAAVQ